MYGRLKLFKEKMEKMQGTENRFLLKQINPALAQDRNFIENLEGTDLNSVVTG